MTELAQLAQSHRKKAGLTQAQLATLAGVGKTVIWDVEHGKESVQWDTLQKIFRVLNITIEWRSPLIERTAAGSPAAADAESSLPAEPPSSPSRKPGRRGRPKGPPTSPFDGIDKLPFDKLRVCDTAGKPRAPSVSRGDDPTADRMTLVRRARPS